jgi:nitric oxide reductase NorD protein
MNGRGAELDDYRDLLAGLGREQLELVRAAWPDARACLGPRGRESYLRAVRSLESIGVTWASIVTFLREAPRVARELGAQAMDGLMETALAVYGYSNQATMEALFAAAPVAARRLREPRRFAEFLGVVQSIAEKAPQGVKPLLGHLDLLLASLSVSDLRTWALMGVQAHARDPFAQESWFDLRTPESRFFLRAEGGVQFSDLRRRLVLGLRALWNEGTELRPFHVTLQQSRAYLSNVGIHLPDAWRAASGERGADLYRATVAHAAAHLAFSPRTPMKRGGLRPIQTVLVGLLEDARVELLACRQMPGLRRLWLQFHDARAEEGAATFAGLAVRLARALLDPGFQDDSPWVQKARRLFFDPASDLADTGMPRRLGSLLGNDIGQMRLQFNAKTWVIEPLYRDDNAFLWEPEGEPEDTALAEEVMLAQPDPVDDPDAQTVEEQRDDATDAGMKPVGEDAPGGGEAGEAVDAVRVVKHPEWDYLIGLSRPQWATVLERHAPVGDAAVVEDILQRNADLLERLDRLIRGSLVRRPVKLRKQMDGDRFDLDALVSAVTDLRQGRTPDPRVHVRVERRDRDLAVLVLLDLSESTNDLVKACNASVLSLAREATVLLSTAMEKIGDSFAVHGFCSNGREEVNYLRFKDFGAPFDDLARARLAGMRGSLSTRMGAAIRHGARWLGGRAAERRLILLITDGEPHDIDVHDRQYLMFDAKKAVEEASRQGVLTYCMSVDPKADAYVSRIFGSRNFMVVDHVNRLPEKLPGLYLRLTR